MIRKPVGWREIPYQFTGISKHDFLFVSNTLISHSEATLEAYILLFDKYTHAYHSPVCFQGKHLIGKLWEVTGLMWREYGYLCLSKIGVSCSLLHEQNENNYT